MASALDGFSDTTREWFLGAFGSATPAQEGAWRAIAGGDSTLVVAPTGSGKTLAAFLWALDRLSHVDSASAASGPSPDPTPGTKVLYISPLKALAVDVERNLRSPLVGITRVAQASGRPTAAVTVGIRSGDTPSSERRALAKEPPDILITTPESLYLMLTSAVRDTLRDVHTVIIDEIHAVAGTKRGAHLAVSLERLDSLLPKPAQRIGLSATVRPHDEVARFLGGRAPVTVVAPASGKKLDIRVVVPVDDLTQIPGRQAGDPREGSAARAVSGSSAPPDSSGFAGGDASGRVSSSISGSGSAAGSGAEGAPGSIWPHVEEDVLRRILEQRSTIVFANSRGLAEKLTARLNELYAEWTSPDGGDGAGGLEGSPFATRTPAVVGSTGSQTSGAPPVLAKAHHGSVSKEQRAIIEDELKTGVLRCVVATSSLELGIDMGLVDLVIQVSAPPSVASGLQRIGRAGHQVGEVSRGLIYPKSRQDLIGAAVESERMTQGLIERISVPTNPLDILAQQTVAAVALEPVQVEDWFETVRRSAPFTTLPRSAFEATLDLLAGRYPSDEFAELRPRVLWDRETGTLTGRPGAQRLAVTSGGTIPDRGMFGVYLAGDESGRGGTRVGELDEEMVYESRINDVFALGATSWRIQQITHDRVVVVPAFGQPGRLPFWHGDGPGRPAELGEALGAFVRELSGAAADAAVDRCAAAGLDDKATANLLRFLGDQKAATGHVPSDRTLVLERFRDELGDWRLVLHSPYGMQVNAPWALAVSARVAERYGVDGSCVAGDDGVVARLPDTEAEPPGAELFLFEPDELDQLVTAEVGGSALFAARFRECAARALLLPRYNPGKRAPLWQQRQRSAQLLDVARKYPTFPILLETARECLQDVYDLPALTGLAARIADRRVRVVEVATEQASPFAQSMLFGYVAAFLYEGDSPLAERRAAALTLDSALLSELLGRAELRELLDPDVIARTEAELQLLAEDRKASGREGTADLLRRLGPLTTAEVAARLTSDSGTSPQQIPAEAEAEAFLAALVADRRALQVPVAGAPHWVAIEDAGRLRDALGTPLPVGIPEAFLTPSADPLADLLSRYARTHGPFTTAEAAARFGLGAAVAAEVLRRLAADGRLSEGEFRPSASGSEWIEPSVLRRLRSRSLAALRKQVEPVDTPAFGRFLPEWQGVGGGLRGVDGVYSVLEQLAGVPAPASAWESLILPARVADYSPAMLDELTVSGEVLWAGAGTLPGNDGWVRLLPSALASTALPPLDQALVPGAGPDDAPITAADADLDELERRVLDTLAGGGGYFFRQLSDAVGSTNDTALTTALWNLAWAGRITGDTLAPLRSLVGAKGAHRTVAPTPRAREFRGALGGGLRVGRTRPPRPSGLPTTSGGPLVAGRWSILPAAESDPTVRAHANAEALLDRYGVVTRGSVMTEGSPGGFAAAYRVLGGIEEAGRCLRGYFIETLGAAQFGTSASIDRLRSFAASDGVDNGTGVRAEATGPSHAPRTTITLAATDPANPYGAALPWPVATGPLATGSDGASDRARTHRPGRKAGAMVVLVDGRLALFIERGGKRVLTFGAAPDTFAAAAESLVSAAKRGKLGRITVESIDGEFAMGTPLADALLAAGFVVTPKGVRLHA